MFIKDGVIKLVFEPNSPVNNVYRRWCVVFKPEQHHYFSKMVCFYLGIGSIYHVISQLKKIYVFRRETVHLSFHYKNIIFRRGSEKLTLKTDQNNYNITKESLKLNTVTQWLSVFINRLRIYRRWCVSAGIWVRFGTTITVLIIFYD